MSPEREREYNELLSYVAFFATVVWKIDPAAAMHPRLAIEEIVRQYGKSKALIGLRQAVNDTVEETRDWNQQARTMLDEGLTAAGLVTLSEISRRYSSSYKRILKRGKIKNETEYYLINAILVDQGSACTEEERIRLQELIDAFESEES